MANDGHTTPKVTAGSLGISTEKPKFSQYAILGKRLESFEKLPWPNNCPVSVQELAEAGLVNTGKMAKQRKVSIKLSAK